MNISTNFWQDLTDPSPHVRDVGVPHWQQRMQLIQEEDEDEDEVGSRALGTVPRYD